jgi:glycosyltransferase involved in cell wall biosynthesis
LPISVLTFSTLYPNAAMPRHGIFVEQRLRQLLADGRVTARVVAPVPWFPFAGRVFGEYGVMAMVPRTETRHGIEITHPRFPTIPKVGMTIAPALLRSAVRGHVRQIAGAAKAQLIDAHYFYPDGVAAVALGRDLGLPVVVTARGTDVSLIPKFPRPRRAIVDAANRCAAIITVSRDLKQGLVDLGVDEQRITVLRNGVDLKLFRPVEASALRAQLGCGLHVLLSVGLLIERKGHNFAIGALPLLPDCRLVIVGDGKLRGELEAQARDLGVAERVEFVRHVNQDKLPEYYSAADALVLMSDREGMANVLLESIGCGTPVVASPAWGTAEVVASPAAGVLLRERSSAALAAGVHALLAAPPSRDATLDYAKAFGWDATTQGQVEIFERIVRG